MSSGTPSKSESKSSSKDVSSPSALSAPGANPHRTSVLSPEQQSFLEKRLQNRPDASHLQSQGILKEGGRLAAQKVKLEHELVGLNISRSIENRPSAEELTASGVLEKSNVAPSLAGVAKKLEKQIIANNLNHKLFTRPSPEDLHIVKGGDVAPRLRGAKIALEHAITRDQVGHLLESRPTPESLVQKGILHENPKAGAAGRSLQSVQKKLQHNMTVDRVGHLLEKREDISALQHQNILKDVRVAPAIQASQRQLEMNLARSNLYHALRHRPSIDELQERGVWHPTEEDDAVAVEMVEAQAYRDAQSQLRSGGQRTAGAPSHPPPSHSQRAQTQHQSHAQAASQSYAPDSYQRRSKNFHLTRILLKFAASMADSGEITAQQKGYFKDLIVDQDRSVLVIADTFDAENDVHDFKDAIIRLVSRK